MGGALAAGSIVSFILRSANMSTLDRYCPSQNTKNQLVCDPAHTSDVNAAHDGAVVEGPLGIGLAAGAAVSAGIAVWLFTSPRSGGVQVAPVVSQRGGMLVVSGPLER